MDTWLFQVERYLNSYSELPQTDGILYAATLLRGTASTWWRYTQPSFQGNWENFKAAVKERWQPVNPQRVARDKIATLRQVGFVADFTAKFVELQIRIPTMTPDEAVDRYV